MPDWIYKMLLTVIIVAIAYFTMDMLGIREYMVNADLVNEPIYFI